MVKKVQNNKTSNVVKMNNLEKISFKITSWVGTPISIIVHTIIFAFFTFLVIKGINFEKVMLIWNTMVSLEAIYLALFIQMTVNRNTESLEEFGDDIEDIQEDVEELGEDVEDISEDIEEDDVVDAQTKAALEHIQNGLQSLAKEIEALKKASAV